MPERWAKIREALGRHRGGKLAALILATVTWYGIQSAINFEARLRDVPVTLILPEGWEVLERSANTAEVVFRGAQEDIRFLDNSRIKIELDLRPRVAALTNLVTRFRILPRHVIAPNTVRPIQIRPDVITVSLDRREEKTVPVKAEFQGVPAEECEVEQWTCTPAVATLSGPRSRLQRIETVHTALVDLDGRVKSFRKPRVSLQVPPGLVAVRPQPPEVALEVTVSERATTAVWPDVPVGVLTTGEGGESARIAPPGVTVSVRGRTEIIKKMDSREIRVYVDTFDIEKAGTYDLPVRVHAPPGLTVTRIEPAVVRVSLGTR